MSENMCNWMRSKQTYTTNLQIKQAIVQSRGGASTSTDKSIICYDPIDRGSVVIIMLATVPLSSS